MDSTEATGGMCGAWWEWQLQGELKGESVSGRRGRGAESAALENKYITHWDPQPPGCLISVAVRISFIVLKML